MIWDYLASANSYIPQHVLRLQALQKDTPDGHDDAERLPRLIEYFKSIPSRYDECLGVARANIAVANRHRFKYENNWHSLQNLDLTIFSASDEKNICSRDYIVSEQHISC